MGADFVLVAIIVHYSSFFSDAAFSPVTRTGNSPVSMNLDFFLVTISCIRWALTGDIDLSKWLINPHRQLSGKRLPAI